MAERLHGTPHSLIYSINGTGAGAGGALTSTAHLGVESFYYAVPDRPQGEGIIVRRIWAKANASAGSPSINIQVQKSTTNLHSAITVSGTTAVTATLSNDGSEVFNPGDVLSVDVTEGTLSTTSSLSNVTIQIDYDRRERPS